MHPDARHDRQAQTADRRITAILVSAALVASTAIATVYFLVLVNAPALLWLDVALSAGCAGLLVWNVRLARENAALVKMLRHSRPG